MNLLRKFLSLLIASLLFSAVWAQTQYPTLNDRYSPKQIDSLIKVFEAKNDKKGLAITHELKGIFFQNIYFYSSVTFNNFFISSQYYLELNDREGAFRVKKRIADLYSVDDVMYTIAVGYYKEALKYFEQKGDEAKIAEYNLDLLNIAINKDSFERTEKRVDSLEQSLETTINLCKKLKDQRYLTYAYNLYGSFLLQGNRLEKAARYIDMSLQMSEPKTQLELLNLYHKGQIKKRKNDIPEAIVLLRRSELIAEIRNNKYLMQRICQALAECYTALNDFPKATEYWQKTYLSINRYYNSGATQLARTAVVNSDLRFANMQQDLIEQKKETSESWNYVLFLALVLLIVLAISIRNGMKAKMQRRELANQRKITTLELQSMKSLIDGQEKERNRVAKDLHDGLGAHLSSIKLFIENQKDKSDPLIQRQLLEPLAKSIDEACLETRNISHDLRPFSLKYGFNTAIEDLVKKVQNALPGVELIFASYGEEPVIREEVALMVYRIVQELLNNAAKYANATQITVQIFYETQQISVHVEDDGLGFDLNGVKEGNGLGNIRSRIDYLGGQVIWQAAPDQGTAVIISVPLQNSIKS